MSIEYLNLAFKADVKPSSLKFVLVSLSDYANECGEAYPSTESLSNKTGQNQKTIRLNLKKLSDLGFIKDTGSRKGSTKQVRVYKISIDLLEASRRLPKTDALKVPKNGRLPKTDTLKVPKNGTPKTTKNGGLKGTQKRVPEPSVLFNHQKEPSGIGKTKKQNSLIYKKIDLSNIPSELGIECAKSFIDHRVNLKKPMTQRAFDRTVMSAGKYSQINVGVEEAFDSTAEYGWLSPNIEYYKNKNNIVDSVGNKPNASVKRFVSDFDQGRYL